MGIGGEKWGKVGISGERWGKAGTFFHNKMTGGGHFG